MRIYLPKPLHGWRALVGEVGIIVLGVLIALGAQQLVQWFHDREELDQVRAALKSELADDRARWEYMSAAEACTFRRLDALDKWMAVSPSPGRLMLIQTSFSICILAHGKSRKGAQSWLKCLSRSA